MKFRIIDCYDYLEYYIDGKLIMKLEFNSVRGGKIDVEVSSNKFHICFSKNELSVYDPRTGGDLTFVAPYLKSVYISPSLPWELDYVEKYKTLCRFYGRRYISLL